jgi:hypothetical protein
MGFTTLSAAENFCNLINNYSWLYGGVTLSCTIRFVPAISNICFPAGTPITTDQGPVPIEHLQPQVHTIHGQVIQHITQTVTLDPYLICFEKHALGLRVPTQRTILSKDHQIEFNGHLVPAERFLQYSSQVKKVKYTGEILYNVLLDTYTTLSVNGLRCETLHPDNVIARLYTNNYSAVERNTLVGALNVALVQRNWAKYKTVLDKIHHTHPL